VVGVYSFLVAVGFMGAFGLVKYADGNWSPGWRELWAGIGLAVLALSPVALLVPRSGGSGIPADPEPEANASSEGDTLGAALRPPALWAFGLATSFYGLVAAGLSLFNQSVLAERGFSRDVFLTITAFTPLVGLAANLATGWLAARWPMGRLLAAAML